MIMRDHQCLDTNKIGRPLICIQVFQKYTIFIIHQEQVQRIALILVILLIDWDFNQILVKLHSNQKVLKENFMPNTSRTLILIIANQKNQFYKIKLFKIIMKKDCLKLDKFFIHNTLTKNITQKTIVKRQLKKLKLLVTMTHL